MVDNWIPVRVRTPEDEEWKIVMTQDGTLYPASFKNNKWVPLFRGGVVEQLLHGRVAYWQDTPESYPYVQCECGSFYLQVNGNQECPMCASFRGVPKEEPKEDQPKEKKTRKPKDKPAEQPANEEIPFTDPAEDLGSLE